MAVTGLDVVDILWMRLKTSGIDITGGIYKGRRPAGSVKEDIVINALPITNTAIQFAIANVNIHPAGEAYTVQGITNSSFNWTRLNAIVKAVKQALDMEDELWTDGYNFNVQQDGLIPDENYYNIRLEFFNENIFN